MLAQCCLVTATAEDKKIGENFPRTFIVGFEPNSGRFSAQEWLKGPWKGEWLKLWPNLDAFLADAPSYFLPVPITYEEAVAKVLEKRKSPASDNRVPYRDVYVAVSRFKHFEV